MNSAAPQNPNFLNDIPLAADPGVAAGPAPLSILRPAQKTSRHEIIYKSRVMHDLICRAISFARSRATVLITGENGTGKELFARLIHESGSQSQARYARVNCAALSETLVESELFGHEKGAFTGADTTRIGRFEWAAGGTLLLDEISEIGVKTQAKLLRVLEENELQRIGSNETVKTNVRIIATSNRDLLTQVQKGKFREDLYYRLNVLRLELPALRDRVQDIPLLANVFLRNHSSESIQPIQGFSKKAIAKLCHHSWPGNIRQLRNVILSCCITTKNEVIQAEDLNISEKPASKRKTPDWMLQMTLEQIEKLLILEHLQRSDQNKTSTAAVLGVTTRTLSNKVNKYLLEGGLGIETAE